MWTKKIEPEIILLDILVEEFEKYRVNCIRRARLLERCQDKIYQFKIEDPERNQQEIDDLGHGTFERCLGRLKRALLIEIEKKTRRHTLIKFDVERIRNHRYQIGTDVQGWRNSVGAYVELDPLKLEGLLREGALLQFANEKESPQTATKEDTFNVVKLAASEIISIIISRSLGFYLSGRSLKESDLIELAMVASRLICEKPSEPFKILIEYTPFPRKKPEAGTMLFPEILRRILGNFETFVRNMYGVELAECDRRNLLSANFGELDCKIREYFDFFYFDHLDPLITKFTKVSNSNLDVNK